MSRIYRKGSDLKLKVAPRYSIDMPDRGQPVGGGVKTNISAFMPLMPAYEAGADTLTHNLLTTAPDDFDAVAMVSINIGAAATRIDKAAFAVSERSDTTKTVPVVGGVEYNTLAAAGTQNGWVPVTWGGAAAIDIPAGSLSRPSLVMSDWMPLSSIARVDGGALPLVLARTYYANRTVAAFTAANQAAAVAIDESLRPFEWANTAQSGVDGVTNPASMTSTWSTATAGVVSRIFCLVFRCRKDARCLMFVGDSIMRGLGGAGDLTSNVAANHTSGWATSAALAIAANSRIGLMNLSVGGQTSSKYTQRALDMLALFKPSDIVFAVYTPNDAVDTDAGQALAFANAARLIDAAWEAGRKVTVVTPFPYESGTEARRQAFVEKIKALGGVSVIDVNVPGVYDASRPSDAYWAAGADIDGTHPSAAGYAAAKTVAIPVLSRL